MQLRVKSVRCSPHLAESACGTTQDLTTLQFTGGMGNRVKQKSEKYDQNKTNTNTTRMKKTVIVIYGLVLVAAAAKSGSSTYIVILSQQRGHLRGFGREQGPAIPITYHFFFFLLLLLLFLLFFSFLPSYCTPQYFPSYRVFPCPIYKTR
ncbi:hypothetical protein M441DRAFT_224558 [Trichoderma asperellum CBS 433.97]|uniref:Uncharacterized protein n=1 Tax=Trichoderma asperellum (strain ATCC 204424 / CBS 433.97 / NBRC 101777) TaxID=1042311 RepID=A0A2T3ZPT4_TRIA4|nr:hypothetical protein M441DRAFT_224558 [Trichoderma asperellum CBS 433.97]PTB46784.1 hypothetical protein M441DRAFT_224558 [Trichoderma asperellum CBS 433.97]